MGIVLTGKRSAIVKALVPMLPESETRVYARVDDEHFPFLFHNRYFFCHGILYPKRGGEQTDEERKLSMDVNFHSTVRWCRKILSQNPYARICIMGSESAYRGSYDDTYAEAKMKLHGFVERTQLQPRQQLVAISCGIISDAGMTTRRADKANLDARRARSPKRRFVTSREVAMLAHDLLYRHEWVSSTVVRMHGGDI